MPQTTSLSQHSFRKNAKDTTSTYGVRGAGVSWQASFGMSLSEADLLFAVRREPVANRIVFQVAHDIFDNWFKVEEVSEKPDGSFDREVQKALAALNAKAVFTQFAVYERLFGWAIIAMSYVDYGKALDTQVSSPKEIIELFPFSTLQFTVQSSDEDTNAESSRYGLPIYYTLRRDKAGQSKLHFTRVIHGATRLLDHPYKGMSVLEPVYDDLTVLRNIRWGLGQTIYRYGSGFPDVEVKGAKRKQLDDLEASQQFKNLQARTYFLHSDDTKLDFKGVAGKALNPEPYYMPIMENIAAGSGLPLAILRGAQAGALTGSEVNEREYFKIISDAQSRYEPCIRQLIDALLDCGQIRFKYNVQRDYRIVWNSGFETTEKDKASIELQQAQARNLKTSWMSVDEIRSEQGLKALPNNEGLVILGLQESNAQNSPPPPSSGVDSEEGLLRNFLRKIRRAKDT